MPLPSINKDAFSPKLFLSIKESINLNSLDFLSTHLPQIHLFNFNIFSKYFGSISGGNFFCLSSFSTSLIVFSITPESIDEG